jgi:hypothetical protein
MVGITIHNEDNLLDKAIDISFRRRDQLTDEVIWSDFSKVARSNARYNALDRMIVVIHSVKMPVGFGKNAIKSKGRPLSETAHLKRSIIKVKAETKCLAHALIIAIARLTKDPNYISLRKGCKILSEVQRLWQTTGIDLQNGVGVHEIQRFHDHFSEYKILVYDGLKGEDIIFEGQVAPDRTLNLLYNDVERHYHVIANLICAMAKRYICEACN